jgi:ABC-type sugar transport system ATPase subunit
MGRVYPHMVEARNLGVALEMQSRSRLAIKAMRRLWSTSLYVFHDQAAILLA